jgi:hypothetical protein
MGYSHLDTIIDLGKKVQLPNKPFVFTKMDNPRYVLLKDDTIFLNIDLFQNDSLERFCLINTGSKPITFREQDRSLIAIKEAQTYEFKWMPCEFWCYSLCGLSYSDYTIQPGQVLIIGTYKKYGKTQTKLRLRLKTKTNGVIISEPYEGQFDEYYFILNSEYERFKYALKTHMDYLK